MAEGDLSQNFRAEVDTILRDAKNLAMAAEYAGVRDLAGVLCSVAALLDEWTRPGAASFGLAESSPTFG